MKGRQLNQRRHLAMLLLPRQTKIQAFSSEGWTCQEQFFSSCEFVFVIAL